MCLIEIYNHVSRDLLAAFISSHLDKKPSIKATVLGNSQLSACSWKDTCLLKSPDAISGKSTKQNRNILFSAKSPLWNQVLDNNDHREHFDGCQMGERLGRWVTKARGLRSRNWLLRSGQNAHGDVERSRGRLVSHILVAMRGVGWAWDLSRWSLGGLCGVWSLWCTPETSVLLCINCMWKIKNDYFKKNR